MPDFRGICLSTRSYNQTLLIIYVILELPETPIPESLDDHSVSRVHPIQVVHVFSALDQLMDVIWSETMVEQKVLKR